ncbi:BRO family protein [Thomasclavelia cocleata]|uniref:BRO family protein n=1 Tax=Thomasclavelia cocleata TaxID=69824 RepID=UPI00272BF165|nr:BRO family protein [Thomasclavelia cocleata]
MNQLQMFKNKEFGEVRSLLINNEPWFVGKDITKILGYQNGSRDINRHVDNEDKGTTEMVTPGGKQKLQIINESGLYALILSSKLPTAKQFKRWVTSEILPSIRKSGGYQLPKNPMDVLKLTFDALTQTNETVAKHDLRITELEENKLLNPGEYNYLNSQVRKRVRTIKEVRKLDLDSQQNRKLYSFINRDLNKYIGIRTRSQFKAKDFEKALQFISEWDLSYTDMKIIEGIKEAVN